MVDIHSHILWGLDDGAKTLEDSVAMVRMAAQAGTTDIVATPHANNQYVYDPELIHARAEELRHAAGENPRIHVGSDFHLSFENIEHALRDPRRYTVNRLRYLMVELPETLIPPHLGRAFEQMRQVGIIPVITHPERNRVLWQDKRLFEVWIEAGCWTGARRISWPAMRMTRSTARRVSMRRFHWWPENTVRKRPTVCSGETLAA
jgi:protein-tyrosine phosphatase